MFWARCNDILEIDWCCFEMVVIRDIINCSSDQFALRYRILQCLMQCHGIYLRGCRAFPLALPAPDNLRLTDRKFQELKALYPTTSPLAHPPHSQWMSDTLTWLIDKRVALRCNPRHNRNVARTIPKSVWGPSKWAPGGKQRRSWRRSTHACNQRRVTVVLTRIHKGT